MMPLRRAAVSARLLLGVTLYCVVAVVASEAACGDEFESCTGGSDPYSPEYTRCIPFTTVPTEAPPAFGRAMLPLFGFAPTYRNWNSGSFGNSPRIVNTQRQAWTELSLQRPDAWMRQGYSLQVVQVRRTCADYVNANADDVVLLENTSSGMNAILRSQLLKSGDGVLVFDTLYDMVTNTLMYIERSLPLQVITAVVQWPVVDEASYTKPLADAIASTPAGVIKMCIFSHVSSVPSVILPIEALTAQCKAIGATVVIDGAHAVGMVDIDITSLAETGVDIWVTNGHKWLYGAHGTAFMWVRPSLQAIVMPTVVSSTSKPAANFTTRYEWIGTRDYAPWCSLNATFNFRTWLGDREIKNYIKKLADEGAAYLVDLFGTDYGVPLAMSHAMTVIGLPTTSYELASKMQATLMRESDTYVVPFERPKGVFWLRQSNQIFLEMADYIELGQAVLNYLNLTASTAGSRWHEQRATLHHHRIQPKPTTATALV